MCETNWYVCKKGERFEGGLLPRCKFKPKEEKTTTKGAVRRKINFIFRMVKEISEKKVP